MQWHKKAFSLLCCLIITWNTLAQVVYEPTYHTVYPYLSRLAQKGVIELDDVVLPLSKDYIYQKLDELSKNITALTPLEREELAFYLKEYTLWWRKDPKSGFEGEYKSVLGSKIGDRFRWLAYQDDNFSVNAQPIVGYEANGNNFKSKTSYGAWIYGYIGKHVGFSFDYRGGTYGGMSENPQTVLNPNQGFQFQKYIPGYTKDFTYNYMNTQITGSWKWGSFSFSKAPLSFGYGSGGKLILSEKAPTYPHIRLDIKPTRWASFSFVHAWLNSDVVDSTSFYSTSIPGSQYLQYSYRNKYLATHILTLKPSKKIAYSIGESVIYNDKLQPTYFLPLAFFTALDHYNGGLKNNSIANTQIFTQISARNVVPKTHLYFTFFIDEMRMKDVFSSDSTKNHTAYTAGISIADFPVKNTSFVVEYTRIRPFVYESYIDAQTYMNDRYSLGHWIGSNADQLYLEFLWRIKRGLHFKTTYSYVRKGDKGTPEQQRSALGLHLLDGRFIQERGDFTMELNYEIIHDLFVKLSYYSVTQKYFEFKELYNTKNLNTINIGLNYGF